MARVETDEERPSSRVLLVEDNAIDALLVQQMLRRQDRRLFELTHTERLDNALEALATAPFDAVLLDLFLPDSEGFATIDAVHAAAPHLPVLVISWHVDEQQALEAVNRGAEDCLAKGDINARALVRAIRHGVERQRTREALGELKVQLRHAQKLEAVGQLAGGVAHDFNNLLTGILGYCELLSEVAGGSREAADYVRQIQGAAGRAAALTAQLLAFSRKQLLRPRVMDLNALIAQFDHLLRRLIGEDITFTARAAPDLWPVHGDPGQLEQVLLNLVVNARDAMPHGGDLMIQTANLELDAGAAARVGLSAAGQYVTVTVTDTGIGMDSQTRSRIFEPFFTTKPAGVGTGLGLSTAYGIVQQSGGQIAVASEPGCGATFTVYLPRTQGDPATPAPVPAAADRTRPPLARILVVEDDDAVRRPVCLFLLRRGYEVTAVTSGREALELLAAGTIDVDVLLTDIVMPGLSGVDVARKAREIKPTLRVAYMSGYTDHPAIRAGMGPDVGFLAKPFGLGDLDRVIGELTARPDNPAS